MQGTMIPGRFTERRESTTFDARLRDHLIPDQVVSCTIFYDGFIIMAAKRGQTASPWVQWSLGADFGRSGTRHGAAP